MPGPTSYSNLEALLLFQYLRTYGINSTAFSKIAEQLNDDPQIRQTSGFDPTRLTPDALRDFFLRVWKDELRYEDTPNSTPSSPRKRKATSPTLPTIQDAANNAELLPKLVIRLYARYREQVVADIREDERKHERLKQEVSEIKRGDWDTKLQKDLDDRRRSHALPRAEANGSVKTPVTTPKQSAALLHPPYSRRDGPGARSPSPNSTTIELPKTVPRHSLQPQPSQGSTAQARPLASQPTPGSTPATHSPYRGSPSLTPQPSHPHRSHSPLTQQTPAGSIAGQPLAPHGAAHTRSQLPTVGTPFPQHGQSPSPVPIPAAGGAAAALGSYGTRPSVGGHYVGPASPHPSQRGGIMLPPFQVAPQVPAPLQHQTPLVTGGQPKLTPRLSGDMLPQDGLSTPQSLKSQQTPATLVLSISKMLSNPSLNNTPVSSPGAAKRLAETKWKETPDAATLSSPTRPRSRSVSPISERAPSPGADIKPKSRRQRRVNSTQLEPVAPSTRSGRTSRRTRGASAASSAIESSARGRTRSQSVVSHSSLDPKVEPSTPMEPMDVSMVEDTPMPAPPSTRRTTRNKRKRSATATSEGVDAMEYIRPMPVERSSVFAVRNFQRLSNAVMNDIMSHKHASIFSHPVRDRDAEGYSSMIRRPTDLKSIKAAIAAGGRVVNAANVGVDSQSGAHLPWSDELVPPKGIVNSAQLERELMRMFANAVMFNPGEEDVVRDAREMFDSAEASLMNFKSAEQRTEASVSGLRKRAESEGSQGAHEDDSAVPTTAGKRRKVG